MDTFAALALATEPPNQKLMQLPPRKSYQFIISRQMAIIIFSTAAVFIAILASLILSYLGAIPDIEWDKLDMESKKKLTVFFSVFIFLQFWNLFNTRGFGFGSSFESIQHNHAFLFVAFLIAAGQIAIVNFGGSLFRTVPLGIEDWGRIIGYTFFILLAGELIRFRNELKTNLKRPKKSKS